MAQSNQNFLFQLGLPPHEWILDYPRIRGIVTEKNRSPLAEPAYYIHRDTWYGNSESQINLWIPLCDITKENGFAFYLNYFSKPIPNDSYKFYYNSWKALGGYQSTNLNKIFPKPLIFLSKENATSFECPRGGVLVFSASHLHGTLPNLTNKTRFSLDLRIVNLRYYFLEIGAPNVDNESQGNNLADMIKL
ncbi:MAG: phytanoyl-CoA dioxygenase family protein [Leptospiraceae bacterium]|nr:phytanoyl-CoA dioxygenase family protein [Leptospiraceae bacterium]